jgi:5-methylcytosine-specific restriction endonuclease McrA
MLRTNDCPALVLNADYRPLSYVPLETLPWQEAVKAALAGRVDIVAEYERVVRSPSHAMKLPSVVALREYQKLDQKAALTRLNIWIRDGFACAYCRKALSSDELTFDHVVPRAQGGTTCFENVVAACARCNARKGSRTPRQAAMALRDPPRHPTKADLNRIGARFMRANVEKTWLDFLYWEGELEA